MNDYLMHYGRKGMKWGQHIFGKTKYDFKNDVVRITTKNKSDIRLPKGSIVSRITSVQNEDNKGRTYISTTDADTARYILGRNDLWLKDDNAYKVDLKVTDDLLIPSYKKVVDNILNTIGTDNSKKALRKTYGLIPSLKASKETMDAFVDAYGNMSLSDCKSFVAREYFSQAMRSKSKAKKLFSDLSKQGYNAVIDYEDASSWGKSERPVIVFERSKNLEQISSKKINKYQEQKAKKYLKTHET